MTAREWICSPAIPFPRRHRCELAPSSIQSFTRFCRNFGGWKRGDLGQSRLWWWQLHCPRSATWGHNAFGGDSSGVKISCRTFGRFVAHTMLSLRFRRDHGDLGQSILCMVVTAPVSKISCRMFSISVAHTMLLLRFWQMEPWWPGAIHTMYGDSSGVQHQLTNVQQICGTQHAFAAI